MKEKKIAIIILLILIVLFVGYTNNKKKSKEQLNDNKSQKITLSEKEIKDSIEQEFQGIQISNVKLVENKNDIITIKLDIKNNNSEEKSTDLSVVFENSKKEECGRMGIDCGILKPNESTSIENNCYIINQNDISSIRIDGEIKSIPKEK